MARYSIFISVGTQLPFDRLVSAVDKYFINRPDVDLVYQVGIGGMKPQRGVVRELMTAHEYADALRACDVFVAHCGTGSMISAFESLKPLVCLPRRSDLGEHRNNHQVDTAKKIDKNLYFVADSESDIGPLIERALELGVNYNDVDIVDYKFVESIDELVELML